jgi:hypothetical protein
MILMNYLCGFISEQEVCLGLLFVKEFRSVIPVIFDRIEIIERDLKAKTRLKMFFCVFS